VTAHLDTARRSALFSEVLRLGAQAWMTGTDRAAFAALEGAARPFEVEDGRVLPR
jgi:DNA replication and repair protein RecF